MAKNNSGMNACSISRRGSSEPLIKSSKASYEWAKGYLTSHRQPRLHVRIITGLGVDDREQKTFGAVKKSNTKHIGAQKRKQPMTDPVRNETFRPEATIISAFAVE